MSIIIERVKLGLNVLFGCFQTQLVSLRFEPEVVHGNPKHVLL